MFTRFAKSRDLRPTHDCTVVGLRKAVERISVGFWHCLSFYGRFSDVWKLGIVRQSTCDAHSWPFIQVLLFLMQSKGWTPTSSLSTNLTSAARRCACVLTSWNWTKPRSSRNSTSELRSSRDVGWLMPSFVPRQTLPSLQTRQPSILLNGW